MNGFRCCRPRVGLRGPQLRPLKGTIYLQFDVDLLNDHLEFARLKQLLFKLIGF